MAILVDYTEKYNKMYHVQLTFSYHLPIAELLLFSGFGCEDFQKEVAY